MFSSPEPWPELHRQAATIEVAAAGGVVLLVALGGTAMIGLGIPFGWDESVYASRSRALVTDIPGPPWGIYRSPGLPIIGLVGGVFGFTDDNLRLVALTMSVLTLAAVWVLSRAVWGPLAAFVALLALLGSPTAIGELGLFHTDLPALGLSLALMVVIWHEFERRPEPTGLLLAAAPLAALAFYVRYGAIFAIGGIAIAAVLLWHRSMLRHLPLVGATVGLAALLLAPHVVEAVERTGSPIGILTAAQEQVDTSEPISTAARYLWWLPTRGAHLVGSLLIIGGVSYGAIATRESIRRHQLTPIARRYVFLYVPAACTALALVLFSHPEPRYMLFPMVLAIVGGAGVAPVLLGWLEGHRIVSGRARRLTLLVIGAGLVAATVVGFSALGKLVAVKQNGDQSRWWSDVGSAIRIDAGGPCAVATTLTPIIGWYSRCKPHPFEKTGWASTPAQGSSVPTYIVFTPIDDVRATAVTIERYRELVDDPIATRLHVADAPAGVEVYRLAALQRVTARD